MLASLLGTLVGVVAGVTATILVSRYYYARAAEDLFKRTMKVLQAFEEAGLVELAKDASGRPTGGIVKQGEVHIRV